MTHAPEYAVLPDHRNDLLEDQRHEQQASAAKNDVMQLEQVLHPQWRAVLHERLYAEDDDEVREEGGEHLLRGRQGSLSINVAR